VQREAAEFLSGKRYGILTPVTLRDHVMNVARRVVPARGQDALRVALGRVDVRALANANGNGEKWNPGVYERLYERLAQELPPTDSIGDGDHDLIGRIELSALLAAGLEAHHTLVDFGCGTGRLAIHAVPRLASGAYVGIDISKTMLAHAEAQVNLLQRTKAESGCRVTWKLQTGVVFDLPPESVDFFAAYSVFTHMEHEDSYRYLLDAHRVVRPGGAFVFSCLTMDVPIDRIFFQRSAELSLEDRWRTVRNVTTTYDYMSAIAALAGWRVERWYKGDEKLIPLDGGDGELAALGQSVGVLRS
jgi:SAM-dependent methyltransferase